MNGHRLTDQRRTLTDGGRSRQRGISPRDVDHLASFLDENQDVSGFTVRLTEPETDRTVRLHDAAIDQQSVERPSAAPALRCVPVDPAEEPFSIRVESILTISVYVPSPDEYMASAETPKERAVGLRRLASVDPTAVDVPTLVGILDGNATTARRNALRGLRLIAESRPQDCPPAIPAIRSDIEGTDRHLRANALATLRAIGDEDPTAIAHLVDDIRPALRAEDGTVRREATRCISAIASEYPSDVTEAVEALAAILEEGASGREYAVYSLSRITTEHPEEVRPVADVLAETIRDRTLSESSRVNATAALGRLVGEDPSIGLDVVGTVATLVDTEHSRLRNNAIGLLGDVAAVHSDAVEPHTPAIAKALTVDDTYTRVNASATLSRIAEDFPSAVSTYRETFETLLTDEEAQVRENACWALGYLRASESRETLHERARRDENADVRKTASWALDRIDA